MNVSLKSDKNNGYFNEDQHDFLIISRPFLIIMRNVSERSFRKNQNTFYF
jgi:hypothetical protein